MIKQLTGSLALLLGFIPVMPAAESVPVVAASEPPPLHFVVPNADQQLQGVIDFSGAPVQAVVEYYGRLTGRSVIQAPTVTGTINFRSQANLTIREAIQALDSVLAINGVAVLPLGDKFLKVVQIATAKQEGVPVLGQGLPLGEADALVTQIISLSNADAAEAVTALQPYVHPYGQLLPLTKSNSILITDTAANIRRMLEILAHIDKPSALRMETRVFIIQNARAADVVQQLQSIIQETEQINAQASAPAPAPGRRVLPRPARNPNQPASPGGSEAESVIEGKVIITSDERTNKIFVLSRPTNFEFFERLIDELDAKVEPDVITRVVELDYANAEDMSGLLNSLITGAALPVRRTSGSPGTPAAPAAPSAVVGGSAGEGGGGLFEFSEGVRIIPDQRTNSLLIMATKGDMERLAALIESMDAAVAQVVIEVVIAEVSLKGDLQLGVDWFKREMGDRITSGGGTRNLGEDESSPIDIVEEGLPAASAIGSGGLTYFLTFSNAKLDAVIRALASSSRFKVLSTPILQTQHNQEADIIVGESRPVVTSTVSDIAASDSTAVRSNVEFRDIAIEMKVTPRINPDGFVTMDIEQKINDVGGNVVVNGIDVPIITKREARATVAVKDQSTIVLGGLIREDKNQTETKVPFLGDIPWFGHLFKSKSNAKNRTELIVFIRPVVLRGDEAATAEARRRTAKLKAAAELELDKVFEGKAASSEEDFSIQELEAERFGRSTEPTPPNEPAQSEETVQP